MRKTIALTILVSFIVVVVLKAYGLSWTRNSSISMAPNYVKDKLVFFRNSRNPAAPQVGEVWIFKMPKGSHFKRVIGLPGDKIRFNNHLVTRNGVEEKIIGEREVSEDLYESIRLKEDNHEYKILTVQFGEYTYEIVVGKNPRPDPATYNREILVPQDCYFVVGDNRENSQDSRYVQLYGYPKYCIPTENFVNRL